MQILWSRVAQAPRVCNCPSCLLTANAIVRRATTATARRTIRVGDIFSVSLSSLAAGLAFEDSSRKDYRRKKWDSVIREAKAVVEAMEIQQQRRLAALSDDARVEAQDNARAAGYDVMAERAIEVVEAWDVPESEEQHQRVPLPVNGTDTWLDVFDWAREQHKLREASGFQDWKGLPLGLLQNLSRAQLDELLSNERLLRRFYGGPDCSDLVDENSRYPLSIKKLRTLEWSVSKMVLKLLKYSSKNSWGCREGSASPTSVLLRELCKDEETMQVKIDQSDKRLRTLHAGRRGYSYYKKFERPQAPNYDDTRIEEYKQTTEMNASLQRVLELMKPGAVLSDPMSKICYNLLTARTPPNTHTYNLLLVRFCVLKKDKLVKAVMRSMSESHVRPNEITHATLLRHFIEAKNAVGFFYYWKRMEGGHRGLALKNPEHEIHPLLKERYRFVGRYHHKAFEKARMNGQVYESLIVGALCFLGSQIAMYYYRRMISEGWSPGLAVLLAILQGCCHRLDWAAGITVLEQLEKTTEKINTLAYECILRLCQCCGQQEFFDQMLRNGVHCGALPASMLDLPNHAKAEDVAFLIQRAKYLQLRRSFRALEKEATRTSYRLGDKSPFLLENAFYGCEDEDTLHHMVSRADKGCEAWFNLQRKLDDISRRINLTVLQANYVLYDSKNLSATKFWLSRGVKRLEKELEQNANSVGYASYSDAVRDKMVQNTGARRAGSGAGERDNPVELANTAGFPESESEHESHVPRGAQHRELDQGRPSSLSPTMNASDDSFGKGPEQPAASPA